MTPLPLCFIGLNTHAASLFYTKQVYYMALITYQKSEVDILSLEICEKLYEKSFEEDIKRKPLSPSKHNIYKTDTGATLFASLHQ
jgi:hypothetical protein